MDKLLYVTLPGPADRVSILKAISTKINFSPDVDLHKIGTSPHAEGYSGADCAALLREAGLAVLKETYQKVPASTKEKNPSDMEVEIDPNNNIDPVSALCIRPHHFDYAFAHVVPSVSRKDQARYQRIRDRMAHARSRGVVVAEAETVSDGDGGEKKDSGTTNQ